MLRDLIAVFSKLLVMPGGHRFYWCMGTVLAYTCGVLWIDDHGFPAQKILDATAAMSTSAIIGLLLVFRTNSAYDRWWEARKLWGQLVNDSRNLALKCVAFVNMQDEEREEVSRLLASFAYALKDHLRLTSAPKVEANMDRGPADGPAAGHAPMQIARQLYQLLAGWKSEGKVDGFTLLQLDVHARGLMDVCGACERIRKSPIASSYKAMIWYGLGMYLSLLPWLLIPSMEDWTLLVMLVASYFAIGLELLAEDVEEPFGTLANDLPLDSICQSLENSVHDALSVSSQRSLTADSVNVG